MKPGDFYDSADAVPRREILKMISLGAFATAAFGTNLAAKPRPTGVGPDGKPFAKTVIQIWMWGGPTHLDTFDPKPEAGYDFCGPLTKTAACKTDGMQIGELLPNLASQSERYSLIRSMTHGSNGHETASYMAQTGRKEGPIVFPSVGAVVQMKKALQGDYKGLVPPYIVLTRPQGRFSEAGFLGQKYKPFATGGNPNDPVFHVEGIVSKDVTMERQEGRKELLGRLDTFGSAMNEDAAVARLDDSKNEAWNLILGDAGKVFDLSKEKPELRDRYGRNPFGQACLVARRLAEIGVPYVTINFEGWDTHKQHFQLMRTKLPQMDNGIATLLQDLSDRGLLDSTIVWCQGEFGRTPRVMWEAPWNGGRSHYGKVFSALVAGGGFRGGQVIGSSDRTGEDVKDRPVYPWDLVGTIYQRLGIDPDGTIPHPQGMDLRMLPGPEEKLPSGGRLTELT